MSSGLTVVDRDNEFIVKYDDLVTVNASKAVRRLFDSLFGPSGVELVDQFENVIHLEIERNEQAGRASNEEQGRPQGPDSSG